MLSYLGHDTTASDRQLTITTRDPIAVLDSCFAIASRLITPSCLWLVWRDAQNMKAAKTMAPAWQPSWRMHSPISAQSFGVGRCVHHCPRCCFPQTQYAPLNITPRLQLASSLRDGACQESLCVPPTSPFHTSCPCEEQSASQACPFLISECWLRLVA